MFPSAPKYFLEFGDAQAQFIEAKMRTYSGNPFEAAYNKPQWAMGTTMEGALKALKPICSTLLQMWNASDAILEAYEQSGRKWRVMCNTLKPLVHGVDEFYAKECTVAWVTQSDWFLPYVFN